MKSLFYVFGLLLSTTALADNLICVIFDNNYEQIARVQFDSESVDILQDHYVNNHNINLALIKMGPGFLSLEATSIIKKEGVSYYPKSFISLEESMIKRMKKGESLGFSLNGDISRRDFVTCYNMKNEDKAPFDLDYQKSKNSPVRENNNLIRHR